MFFLLFACSKEDIKSEQFTCPDISELEQHQNYFLDVSQNWGLTAISPTGYRIAAVDFNGDDWPDLLIRSSDEIDQPDNRTTWLLKNNQDKTFTDVTSESGILIGRDGDIRPGQVSAFGDVDNDGDIDLYLASPISNGHTPEILLNDGSGFFTLSSDDSDLRLPGFDGSSAASFVDYNLDGNLDLWIPQGSAEQDRLLWGYGDGRFTDVTRAVGLGTKPWNSISDLNEALSHSNSWSGVACDINNDGYAELLSASYGRAPNHLWLNEQGEMFQNQSISSGYAFDDHQDWTDNESARCWCFLHPEDEDCQGVPEPEVISCQSDDDAFRWNHNQDRNPFRLGGNSGTTVCADINNDGYFDLLTTEIVHWDVGGSSDPSEILYNIGQDDIIAFERPGNDITGLTREYEGVTYDDGDITAVVFDFDNDGRQDIYIGSTDYPSTRGLLYHQQDTGVFHSVDIDMGIDHVRSHGVAVADFDRDGDLDIVVGHSRNRCGGECYDTAQVRFFENQISGRFVQLSLQGRGGSNRSAIGARVVVEHDGMVQSQQIGGGFGHYGMQNDLVLHFGLGDSCEANVTVHWPDVERTTTEMSVKAGGLYKIIQE